MLQLQQICMLSDKEPDRSHPGFKLGTVCWMQISRVGRQDLSRKGLQQCPCRHCRWRHLIFHTCLHASQACRRLCLWLHGSTRPGGLGMGACVNDHTLIVISLLFVVDGSIDICVNLGTLLVPCPILLDDGKEGLQPSILRLNCPGMQLIVLW